MHWLRLVLFHIIPLLLAVAAPLLLLWAWGAGLALLPALLVGLLFLSTALVVFLLGTLSQPAVTEHHDALWMELETLRQQLRQLMAQPPQQQGEPAHEQPAAPSPHPSPDSTSQQSSAPAPATPVAASHEQAAAPSPDATTSATPQPATSSMPSTPASAMPAVQTGAAVPEALQSFQLYMEPVVELSSQRVWLYRALPALPAQDGRFYLGRHAQLRARALGVAGALQGMILADCLRFASALHARGGGTPVICPLDVAALAHAGTVRHLHEMLGEGANQARAREGMLLSLSADELAQGGRAARQHVLELSAQVAAFLLEHGSLPDPGTPLPLPLLVRYVETPASALKLPGGQTGAVQYRQEMEARGMALIASDIDDQQLLEQVRPLAALGRGRLFGAPRRVRLPDASGSNHQGNALQAHASTAHEMAPLAVAH